MQLEKIKDNLYVPTDFKKNHAYYADPGGEKAYTGITSVLSVVAKPNLIPWAARMACEYILEHGTTETEKYCGTDGDIGQEWIAIRRSELENARTAHTKKKEAAGEHGTGAHELVEEWINYCLEHHLGHPTLWLRDGDKGLEEATPSIQPFIDWSIENVDRFLFSERRMCDPNLWLAGTADFAYIGKDGKRYMSDFKTNSAVYYEMWMQTAAYQHMAELEDEKYDRRSVVRLGKKGDFEVQWREDFETDWEAFKACLTLYRAQRTYKN